MRLVPFSIIQAARTHDAEAVDFIVRHFEIYIVYKSLCTHTDEYGNTRRSIDDDLHYRAQSALLSAIYTFNLRDPPDDFTA